MSTCSTIQVHAGLLTLLASPSTPNFPRSQPPSPLILLRALLFQLCSLVVSLFALSFACSWSFLCLPLSFSSTLSLCSASASPIGLVWSTMLCLSGLDSSRCSYKKNLSLDHTMSSHVFSLYTEYLLNRRHHYYIN